MDLLVGTLALRPYVFLFMAAFLIAAARDLGPRRTLAFGGVVWPIAWAAEWSSIHVGFPFGLYHYTGLTVGQELYVAGMPVFDSLSFSFLAYAAYCLTRKVVTVARPGLGPRVARALLTGFFMTMLDVVIDPAAVRGERWFLGHLFDYAEEGVYFGVPLSNFGGWWLVGAVGVLAYDACARGERSREGGRVEAGIALYYAVFLFNLAVTAWIGEWTLVALGFAVHALMALAIVAVAWRAPAWSALRTRRVERA
jgi:putative membrane protein